MDSCDSQLSQSAGTGPTTDLRRIVIVGAGVAGTRCAFELRKQAYDGKITLVGEEQEVPYDRTLLSTDMLATDREVRRLRQPAHFAAAGIDLRLGVAASRLLPGELQLTDGAAMPYDRLIICTGGRARVPKALASPGVATLRNLADLKRLRRLLDRAEHLVVVGGGFLGSEIASSARFRNLDVTLVESASHPMSRVFGEGTGAHLGQLHHAAGINLRCGVGVTRIDNAGSRYDVTLDDGSVIACDGVVVCVGMRPAIGWLDGTPLEGTDGILTDRYCRTSLPGVLAAGDCARFHHPGYAASVRFEHWETAAQHGVAAARSALGKDSLFAPVPFAWSHQHGATLRCIGLVDGYDDVQLVQASSATFAARYFSKGKLQAVLSCNDTKSIAEARTEIHRILLSRRAIYG